MTATTAAEPTDEAERVARTIVSNMTAQEIRKWMSPRDVTRTRGATKMESVLEIYEQDPAAARDLAGTVQWRYEVDCPHCDYDTESAAPEGAVSAAKEHKSENPSHFPKATDALTEDRLYG